MIPKNNWGNQQQQVALFMALMRSDKQKVRFAPTLDPLARPTDEEIDLRCRLMLEECLETIKALKRRVFVQSSHASDKSDEVSGDRMDGVTFVKTGNIETIGDLVEIADGLADQKVVVVGTDICFGFNADRCFDLVQGNNNAKFRPGHKYENGKLIKPPDHKPVTGLLYEEICREIAAVEALGHGSTQG